MTVEPPAWDASDCRLSCGAFASWLNGEARRQFTDAGTHVELIFLLSGEGVMQLVPVPPKVDRAGFSASLKEAIASEPRVYAVLHVSEAWAYIRRGEKDHIYTQILFGEMGVSDLDPADKTEALIVSMENRDGDCLTLLNPIVRKGEEVLLSEPVAMSERTSGKFGGWFAGG